MNQSDDIRTRVRQSSAKSAGLSLLRELLATGKPLEDIGQGRMTVRDAQTTFSLRQRTLAAANVAGEGLEELLTAIASPPSDANLALHHVGDAERTFTVAIHEPSDNVVGCISVPRRSLQQP